MSNAHVTLSPVVDNEGYFFVRFAKSDGSLSTLALLLSFDENSHIHPDSNGVLSISQVTESVPNSSATLLVPDSNGVYSGSFCSFSLGRYPSINIEYDDSVYLCSAYPFVHVSSSNLSIVNTLFGGSSGGSSGGSNVDLSSVTSSLNSIFSALNSLSDQIYHLDLQIPDDLSSKIQALDAQVSNIDLSSLPMNLTPLDLTDLNGNYCKYPNGTLVYYGAYGIHEVVKSSLSLTADNQLTPFYVVRRNVNPDENGVPEYVYNNVPQDYLFPIVDDKKNNMVS